MSHFVAKRVSEISSTSDAEVKPRRLLILLACMMATATAAIESTIVATAMPTIIANLHGAEYYSWVFSAYMLTQAVTIPIYGRLADQYGRRRVFFAGSTLFFIGSALCGCAPGMVGLIIFRAVQGCGAGAVQPIAYTIVGDIYAPAERARIQGLLSAIFGASAIIGPPIGAFLMAVSTWRLVFWINLPITIAAIAMIMAFLSETPRAVRHKLDLLGAFLLIVGVGALVWTIDRGQEMTPIELLLTASLGVASLAALIRHERRAAEPILPLALWKNRLIVLVSLGSLTVGAIIMALIAFLPSFIQAPMGRSADATGLVLGAMLVAWTLGSVVSGQLMVRFPYRLAACVGSVAIMTGAGLLLTLNPLSSMLHVVLGASIVGIGLGFCNTTWIVSVQGAVAYDQRGSATSAAMFMRFLGQALGAAVAGVLLTFALHMALPTLSDPLGELLASASTRSAPAVEQLAAVVSKCFRGIFAMTELLGIATLIIALLLPRSLRADRKRPT
jgi:EmrB/QacA subfamily drug resistance transporter